MSDVRSPITLLALILLAVVVIGFLVLLASRAIRWARRGRGGAEFVAGVVESIDVGSALNPAREVAREKRKLKRSEEGSGDADRGSADQ